MAELITMPKFGLTMTEGNVMNWTKQKGDQVKKGDPLFDVETDKVTNEVESPLDGYIRYIFIQEGYEIPCGEPIAIIGGKDEDISSLLDDQSESSVEEKKEESYKELTVNSNSAENDMDNREDHILATPRAKSLALKKQINIKDVQGTGPRGIVTSKDIYNKKNVTISPMAKKWAHENDIELTGIQQDRRILLPDVIAASLDKNNTQSLGNTNTTTHVLKGIRKVISENMSRIWQEVPHVTLNREIDVTAALEIMDHLKEIGLEKEVKITFTHLLVKIVASILPNHPYLNAWFDGNEINLHQKVHIGVATTIDNGLVVPVIKDAENKSLNIIIDDLNRLVRAVRSSEYDSSDISGSTFTISNLGMFGIDTFTPIINQPETAILGIGRIVEKPFFVGEDIQKRSFISFSLSFDHRVIDGVPAADFLQELDSYLQQPLRLLFGGNNNE